MPPQVPRLTRQTDYCLYCRRYVVLGYRRKYLSKSWLNWLRELDWLLSCWRRQFNNAYAVIDFQCQRVCKWQSNQRNFMQMSSILTILGPLTWLSSILVDDDLNEMISMKCDIAEYVGHETKWSWTFLLQTDNTISDTWDLSSLLEQWTWDNAIWNPGRKYAGDLAGKKSAQLFSIKMWVSARRKDGGGLVMIITMKSFIGWWWWSPWRVLYPILILFPILVDDEHRHEECCVLWRGASQGSLPVDKIGIHHCFRHTDHHFKKNRQRNHYSHLLPTSVGSLMWMFTLVPTHKEMKHLPTLY